MTEIPEWEGYTREMGSLDSRMRHRNLQPGNSRRGVRMESVVVCVRVGDCFTSTFVGHVVIRGNE